MTERPIYRVTVTNDDQGWTETIEHRQALPDDVRRILIDDFQLTWSLEGDQVPARLATDTCKFSLYCRTAADVPAIEVGDVLLVNLDRVGPGGTLIPYMHFAGRASDPDATATPHKGIVLDVDATGFAVDLSPEVDLGNDASVTYQTEGYLVNLVRDQAGVSAIFHSPAVFTRSVRPFGQMPAQDAADRLVAGTANGVRVAILRYAYKWAQWDATGLTNDGLPAGWFGAQGDNPDLAVYLQEWLLQLPPPLTLVEAAGAPRRVTLGPDAATVDKVATIPAGVCRVPASWSKSRADLVNTTTVIYGVTDSAGTGLKEAKAVIKDAASVARYGPAPREVSTFVTIGSTNAVGGSYQNPAPGTLGWSIPSLTILPELMTDEQLDELAPTFYPHAMPIGSTAGRFIILTDLDEDTAVAGRDVALQITGATFSIAEGRLTIGLQVHAVNGADFATAITFNDLAASPVGDVTFDDTGAGHYIDPAVDIDELTYTDA